MFKKVLIANRGAIATRIIRSLKKLGVTSVAVYAQSDSESLHVKYADEALCLGEGDATQTYLNRHKLITCAKKLDVDAIHPGYGFLSENADFEQQCEAEGIVFIGPTAQQILAFGLKHRARELAERAQVPLLPGSGLLHDVEQAKAEAQRIGYPVMLKSSAGGGGIGMQLCHNQTQIEQAFDSVRRLGANNFADDRVFIEKFIARARHIEVQVFGDGHGLAIALGERDCSCQRRNQKVVEECPAPNLSDATRKALHSTAEQLLASVHYRNAGTVEFIVDADTEDFYFLEVNTRLQVEHGVTEAVFDIDLVEWMLKLAAGVALNLPQLQSRLRPMGHAIQTRVYAEDPYREFQPCAGLLSQVEFPTGPGVRIDHWLQPGIEIPPWFDPMLAKVIVHADNRTQALIKLTQILQSIDLYGTQTNLEYLIAFTQDQQLQNGTVTTRYLNDFSFHPKRIEVVSGGTQTTVQDFPGRRGYWQVGVPPSGPFDSYSFRLGNRLLGNTADMAGLEITLQGPTLRFCQNSWINITGADIEARLDDTAIACYENIAVGAGQTLVLGRLQEVGARAYLCVRGGIQCPDYLGSKATFTLGQFGGHNGRALSTGDILQLSADTSAPPLMTLPTALKPCLANHTQLRVIYGPHGAPDFFTEADIETFFNTDWEVHYNSSRTGIRLIGPKPDWARADGGEAGLHPSNIHDNAYAFGTVDFTGDMPVILGPDGPSLGGFVCPATVITADLWKLGQLRAGDRVRFAPVSLEMACALEAQQSNQLSSLQEVPCSVTSQPPLASPILHTIEQDENGEQVVYRAAGDHFLLVEYGPQMLDIRLRFRVHALMQWLEHNPLPGILELTPGIRSLQIHYNSQALEYHTLLAHLKTVESVLDATLEQLRLPSRIVHLPLSWDDSACQLAIDKYQQSVRKNAPWCPSNLEFIRRINGFKSIEDIKRIIFDASYLVMGLGDVYLGAPVATPVDPRHRLVTTKYNPARTWTAENSVGIGGSYLCVYGMEGPGGYQFVGRTLQMWNRYHSTQEFSQPWLLRFFDQIRFYPVSHDELVQIRQDFPQGRYPLNIEACEFNLTDYQTMLTQHGEDIAAFRQQRQGAFEQELASWHADGQFHYEEQEQPAECDTQDWSDDQLAVDSPVSGSVWQLQVAEGDHVNAGDLLLVLESMKMEIPVFAPTTGTIARLLKPAGKHITAGQALVIMEEDH